MPFVRCSELPTAPAPPRAVTRNAGGRELAHPEEKINQGAASLQDCRAAPGSRHQVPGHAPKAAAPSRPRRGAAAPSRRSRCGPAGRYRGLPSVPEPPGETTREAADRDPAHRKA